MHVGGGSAFAGVYLCGVVRTASGWRIRDYGWAAHTRENPADAERVRAWMRKPPQPGLMAGEARATPTGGAYWAGLRAAVRPSTVYVKKPIIISSHVWSPQRTVAGNGN